MKWLLLPLILACALYGLLRCEHEFPRWQGCWDREGRLRMACLEHLIVERPR